MDTQLRVNTAVGPGDVLIVLWIVPMLLLESASFQWKVSPEFWDLMRFWAVFAVGQSLGLVLTLARGAFSDWTLTLHDIFAYLLLIALTGLLTISPWSEMRLRRIQWITIVLGSALLLVQLAQAYGMITIRTIDPWYWDRFRGWSENPNQLAFNSLAIAILSLSCVELSRKTSSRLVAFACAGVAIYSGWLTQSKAYAIVIIGAVILLSLIKATRWIARLERDGIKSISLVTMPVALLSLAVCLIALVPRQSAAVDWIRSASLRESKVESDDELKLRIYLWQEAVKRGLESDFLGFGPGPHLEIPYTILVDRRSSGEPPESYEPQAGLAPNFEAHNTVLELLVQGGLITAGAFLWVWTTAIARAWRAESDAMAILILALGAFSIFHVVMRYPILWFIISLGLLAGTAERGVPRVERGTSSSLRAHPRTATISPGVQT